MQSNRKIRSSFEPGLENGSTPFGETRKGTTHGRGIGHGLAGDTPAPTAALSGFECESTTGPGGPSTQAGVEFLDEGIRRSKLLDVDDLDEVFDGSRNQSQLARRLDGKRLVVDRCQEICRRA
jgi:hypothetical protein